MRFDLSDEQKALADTADRALAAANGTDRAASAITALGIADADALLSSGSPLLTLALVAEAAGRHLAPLAPVHSALAFLLIGDDLHGGARSEIATRGGAIFLALGDGKSRLVEGDDNSWALWQDGGALALYPPGACALGEAGRADTSRSLRRATTPRGGRYLTIGSAASARDAMLTLQAADSFGTASAAFEMTLRYARTRTQFARPLASFQAYQHQMADLAVALDPCRFLWWRAAYAWDHGEDRERLAALAKAHVCEAAVGVTRAAVEAHGAMGFTAEYPLGGHVRRAAENACTLGTPAAIRDVYARNATW